MLRVGRIIAPRRMGVNEVGSGRSAVALRMACSPVDVKAVSQNLMHGNVGNTDGIYAILSDQDRRDRIRGLGSETSASSTRLSSPKSVESLGDVIGQLEMLLARLKAKS